MSDKMSDNNQYISDFIGRMSEKIKQSVTTKQENRLDLNLAKIIEEGESSTVEFKVAAPRVGDLAERLCGFANSRFGGTVIIGISDGTRTVRGVKNIGETIDLVLRAARLCKPAVILDPPEVLTMEYEGKQLVIVKIPPNKGVLHQAGGTFWLRRGTYTTPLGLDEIERYLYSSGSLNWETQPVPTATLDDIDRRLVEEYLAARSSFSRSSRRLPDLERILINLGCAMKEGDLVRPTNAGILLFGYNPQDFLLQGEIVCALYPDTKGLRRFSDRRIFHGTMTHQIDQAENWMRQYIAIPAQIEGFQRVDKPDYPLEALREAVVNAVVHRDYSLKGTAVRIFFYSDRVEIRNPGLLLPGLSLVDLKQGKALSLPRNPVLATVLREMPGNYVERLGSGVAFMINKMREMGRREPEFREEGEFSVTFWRATGNSAPEFSPTPLEINLPQPEATPLPVIELTAAERQQKAIEFVERYGRTTNRQHRELTGVAEKTAFRDLESLVAQGRLIATGQRKGRYYSITK
jgi:ATP-dependent DNA helicase RecG